MKLFILRLDPFPEAIRNSCLQDENPHPWRTQEQGLVLDGQCGFAIERKKLLLHCYRWGVPLLFDLSWPFFCMPRPTPIARPIVNPKPEPIATPKAMLCNATPTAVQTPLPFFRWQPRKMKTAKRELTLPHYVGKSGSPIWKIPW
jgi:hypothetical protein